VIEETGSVEVLWDRGMKREFKWGSVVFGNTDSPVLQKPSEPLEPPPNGGTGYPISSYQSSTSQALTSFSVPLTSTHQDLPPTMQYPNAAYGHRSYQSGPHATQVIQSAVTTPHTFDEGSLSSITSYNYHGGSTPWQVVDDGNASQLSAQCTPHPVSICPTPSEPSPSLPQTPPIVHNSAPNSLAHAQTSCASTDPLPSTLIPQVQTPVGTRTPSQYPHPTDQTAFLDFSALKALPPAQLAHLVQTNTEFRNLLLGSIGGPS
jgi:hypothetical protein